MSQPPELPAPRPRVSPFVLPLGMRRRNAYGRLPMDPGLLPMNLLRAHLYPGNEQAVQEGVAELRANIAAGSAVAQLPQRMAFQWHKPVNENGDGPGRDPRASAASVAAAVAAQGRIATFVHEQVVTPQDPREAEMRAYVQQQLFAQHVTGGDTVPTDPARQTAQTWRPTDSAILDAYGDAATVVAENRASRRGGYIGKALSEIAAQSSKVLGMVRARAVARANEVG